MANRELLVFSCYGFDIFLRGCLDAHTLLFGVFLWIQFSMACCCMGRNMIVSLVFGSATLLEIDQDRLIGI